MNKIFFLLLVTVIYASASWGALSKPTDIAKAWAEAAKERNGKAQYQLMCQSQQKKYYGTLKNLNWVTGLSSPEIGNYKVLKLRENQRYAEFIIHYQMLLNDTPVGTVTDRLRIMHGCISEFLYLSPSSIKPQPSM